jgi:hypothetical protein
MDSVGNMNNSSMDYNKLLDSNRDTFQAANRTDEKAFKLTFMRLLGKRVAVKENGQKFYLSKKQLKENFEGNVKLAKAYGDLQGYAASVVAKRDTNSVKNVHKLSSEQINEGLGQLTDANQPSWVDHLKPEQMQGVDFKKLGEPAIARLIGRKVPSQANVKARISQLNGTQINDILEKNLAVQNLDKNLSADQVKEIKPECFKNNQFLQFSCKLDESFAQKLTGEQIHAVKQALIESEGKSSWHLLQDKLTSSQKESLVQYELSLKNSALDDFAF